MWGWDNADIVFASRSKRWRTSDEDERWGGNTLIATVRSSRVSRAFHTSPMPPAPRGETISYGPSRVPAPITNQQPRITNRPASLLLHLRRPVQYDRHGCGVGALGRSVDENALAVTRNGVIDHGSAKKT